MKLLGSGVSIWIVSGVENMAAAPLWSDTRLRRDGNSKSGQPPFFGPQLLVPPFGETLRSCVLACNSVNLVVGIMESTSACSD